MGSRLHIVVGNPRDELARLAVRIGATAVYWNRRYEPAHIECDKQVKIHLAAQGIHCESFLGNYIHEPWEVLKADGTPYQVYTAFWNAKVRHKVAEPLPAVRKMPGLPPEHGPSCSVDALGLRPKISWDTGLRESWNPTERDAQSVWTKFRNAGLTGYSVGRYVPAHFGTSRLSPYLHFGQVSVREIWHQTLGGRSYSNAVGGDTTQFLKELVWRDFAAHLLFYFPRSDHEPLRSQFENLPWRHAPAKLRAWQLGRTGYPIVDAGMRELWATGWMHNRVRMIVASFLVKDLMIHWREGARWFWDTLVDFDLASNSLGWQWCAGCGADAAPYFRIFNPTLQGKKFDPDGAYVRRWIPELKDLGGRWIHEPWLAPRSAWDAIGKRFGLDYPEPIVDHDVARIDALCAYEKIKK
jgi:deoxyribodipyrimidine photo-lyase